MSLPGSRDLYVNRSALSTNRSICSCLSMEYQAGEDSRPEYHHIAYCSGSKCPRAIRSNPTTSSEIRASQAWSQYMHRDQFLMYYRKYHLSDLVGYTFRADHLSSDAIRVVSKPANMASEQYSVSSELEPH